MKIVSDAGPILSFARAGRLEILRQVVGELIIPQAVVEELAVLGSLLLLAARPDIWCEQTERERAIVR